MAGERREWVSGEPIFPNEHLWRPVGESVLNADESPEVVAQRELDRIHKADLERLSRSKRIPHVLRGTTDFSADSSIANPKNGDENEFKSKSVG